MRWAHAVAAGIVLIGTGCAQPSRSREMCGNEREVEDIGGWSIPGRNIGVSGLFMGTAGVGHAPLSLAYPSFVPSVLFLEGLRPGIGLNN